MTPNSSSPDPLSSPKRDGAGLGTPNSPADAPAEGTSTELATQLAEIDLSTSRGDGPALDLGETLTLAEGSTEIETRRPAPALSLSTVILGSYASAVTLALIWILATAKTLPGRRAETSGRVFEDRPSVSSRAFDSFASDRSVNLGKTMVVGDLEIMPLMVLHKTVRTTRGDGREGSGREIPNCLTLTVRLKNTSKDRPLTPLEHPSVWNGDSGDTSHVEMGMGRRISVLDLNWQSDESIDSQRFPAIAPGAVADIVLVSEPVPFERLVGPLTWWVALKTGEDEMETIGVRFSRREVDQVGD